VTEQQVRYEVVDGGARWAAALPWLVPPRRIASNAPLSVLAAKKTVRLVATNQRTGRPGAGNIAAAPPDTTKAAKLQTVVTDLAAETDSVVTRLARLATADWDAPTPGRSADLFAALPTGGRP
jgi:hypothetical protein